MTINVLGKDIKVRKEPLVEKNLRGYYDTHKEEIVLCTTLSKEIEAQTLIHEILHATLFRIYIGNVIHNEVHETIVDVCATVISENFKLVCKKKK